MSIAVPSSVRRPLPAAILAGAIALFAAAPASAVGEGTAQSSIADLIRPTTDFSKPEPGEAFPGGRATSRKSVDNRNAFSHSSGNMSFESELNFKVGNAIFRKLWVSAPASTKASDGLGPLFNARSCQRCHIKDGRGHPPEANWPEDDAVSMFLRLSIPPQTQADRERRRTRRAKVIPEPTYGGQLQDLAIQGHAGEGRMHITYEEVPVTLAGGEIVRLRKPVYRITDLGHGPLHPETMISPRVAPQMIGLGLLEAVPEDQILEREDPDDKDGDGISGRANRVWSLEQDRVMLGRFGLKAGNPTILQQSAEAFAGDIGISNPLVRQASGDCTARQQHCLKAPNGDTEAHGGLELSQELLDLTVFYSQNLAVPRRRAHDDPVILAGKALFYGIGCAACHRPKLYTGTVEGQPHLSNQLIWPYTDMLLHDMGEALADGRPEGDAEGREWRTAPLWGVGLTEVVSGHRFLLHDGRARGVKEAILWHGGEAQTARDAFAALSKAERDKLIAFVNSL